MNLKLDKLLNNLLLCPTNSPMDILQVLNHTNQAIIVIAMIINSHHNTNLLHNQILNQYQVMICPLNISKLLAQKAINNEEQELC
jgi:hypothetical protein